MKRIISTLLVLLVLPLVSCSQKNIQQPQTGKTDVQSLVNLDWPLFQTLNDNQSLRILDVCENSVLLALDQLNREQEQGLNTKTVQLILLSSENGDVIEAYPLSDNLFCPSGVVDQNLNITYTLLDMAQVHFPESYLSYQIYTHNYNKDPEMIEISGTCEPISQQTPCFARLDENSLACSYWDQKTQSYGISIIDANQNIEVQFNESNGNGNSLVATTLQSHAQRYLYFTERENKGIFVIGDSEHIIHQIELPENEQLYSYCLLENGILFSSYVPDSSEGTDYLIYRDFDGNELARKEHQAMYRMTSNANGHVLGIDGTYQIYDFSISTNDIIGKHLDVQQFINGRKPVQFYPTYDNQFLMFFYLQNPQLVLQYQLS